MMSSKPPPIPPENRSDKGPGEGPEARIKDESKQASPPDHKTGQAANTKINTTHQGSQQDR